MRVVPDRVEGMGLEVLTSEYRRIMEIVAGADGPVMTKDVALAVGREATPAKIEPVRASCVNSPTGAGSRAPHRAVTDPADQRRRRPDGPLLPVT